MDFLSEFSVDEMVLTERIGRFERRKTTKGVSDTNPDCNNDSVVGEKPFMAFGHSIVVLFMTNSNSSLFFSRRWAIKPRVAQREAARLAQFEVAVEISV